MNKNQRLELIKELAQNRMAEKQKEIPKYGIYEDVSGDFDMQLCSEHPIFTSNDLAASYLLSEVYGINDAMEMLENPSECRFLVMPMNDDDLQ